jgi:hypothetical protein
VNPVPKLEEEEEEEEEPSGAPILKAVSILTTIFKQIVVRIAVNFILTTNNITD